MNKKNKDSVARQVFDRVVAINKLIQNGLLHIDQKERSVLLSPDVWLLFGRNPVPFFESVNYFIHTAHAIRKGMELQPAWVPGKTDPAEKEFELPDADELMREFETLLLPTLPLRFAVVGPLAGVMLKGVFNGGVVSFD